MPTSVFTGQSGCIESFERRFSLSGWHPQARSNGCPGATATSWRARHHMVSCETQSC